MRNYLNDCRKIEELIGEGYRKLARARIYSVRLRSIFEQMAADEEGHARQLEVARGVPEEVFFEGKQFDPEQIDELLRKATSFVELADLPPRSEKQVLQTARDLEEAFMEVHLQNAVRFREDSLGDLFNDLAREDQKHLETLDSYFGGNSAPGRSYQ